MLLKLFLLYMFYIYISLQISSNQQCFNSVDSPFEEGKYLHRNFNMAKKSCPGGANLGHRYNVQILSIQCSVEYRRL